jgi:hypothetical protein
MPSHVRSTAPSERGVTESCATGVASDAERCKSTPGKK